MEKYRIYEVTSIRIKPNKGGDAAGWWPEKGKATSEVSPGTKSVKAYAVQFGIGGTTPSGSAIRRQEARRIQ